MLPPMDTPVGDDALLWLWYEGQINSDVLAARRLGSPELSRNRRRPRAALHRAERVRVRLGVVERGADDVEVVGRERPRVGPPVLDDGGQEYDQWPHALPAD